MHGCSRGSGEAENSIHSPLGNIGEINPNVDSQNKEAKVVSFGEF